MSKEWLEQQRKEIEGLMKERLEDKKAYERLHCDELVKENDLKLAYYQGALDFIRLSLEQLRIDELCKRSNS